MPKACLEVITRLKSCPIVGDFLIHVLYMLYSLNHNGLIFFPLFALFLQISERKLKMCFFCSLDVCSMDVFSSVFLSLLVHVQRGATGLGIHEMQK